MENNRYTEFGIKLKNLLKEKGISQLQFSKEIDVPFSTVNSWVNGKAYPRLPQLTRLEEYFDTRFTGGDDDNIRGGVINLDDILKNEEFILKIDNTIVPEDVKKQIYNYALFLTNKAYEDL